MDNQGNSNDVTRLVENMRWYANRQPKAVQKVILDFANEVSTLTASAAEGRNRGLEEAAKICEIDRRVDLAKDNGYEPSWHKHGMGLAAEITRLTTALETARRDALEEAAAKVRQDCPACNGSGHDGPEAECQYCGIPMAAIRNLLPAPATEEAKT